MACIEKSQPACRMLGKANIGTVNSILELGCGFGRNFVELMRYTNAFFDLGSDISETAIAYAERPDGSSSKKFMVCADHRILRQLLRRYGRSMIDCLIW